MGKKKVPMTPINLTSVKLKILPPKGYRVVIVDATAGLVRYEPIRKKAKKKGGRDG